MERLAVNYNKSYYEIKIKFTAKIQHIEIVIQFFILLFDPLLNKK